MRCFVKAAQASLDDSTCYREIVSFANKLNEKANQLLVRAALNKEVDMQQLQRELFETGREFIRTFANKFNQHKPLGNLDEAIAEKKYDPGA
jgi:hypothetical protein